MKRGARRQGSRSQNSRRLAAETLEQRRLLAIDVVQVANLNATNPWGSIREFASVGSQAFFVAGEPNANRLDLWITDGTSAGTTRLADLGPTAQSDFGTRLLTNVDGTLYFKGHDDAHGHELWKSDGTAGGTAMVRDLSPGSRSSQLSNFVSFGGRLLFSGNGHLMRSDGTAETTVRIKDLRPDASDGAGDFLVDGGVVYFTAQDDAEGVDLFKTNGTRAGTVLVHDAGASVVGNLGTSGGKLFFTQDQRNLWKSDGSEAGTELVTDFTSTQFGAYPSLLTDVNGTLFFNSFGDIWKSDGTEAGTVRLKHTEGHDAYNFFNMEGTLYFAAGRSHDLGHGVELWKSDGTPEGTVEVVDLSPGFFEGYGDNSHPRSFTNLNGTLYFAADTPQGFGSLWTTDGTAEGTTLVEGGNISALVQHGDGFLFARQTAAFNNFSLWNTDGTAGAAVEIPRLGPGSGNADPGKPVDVNGVLYFAANDGLHGSELWKLEGGVTSLVKDILPGPGGSVIANLTSAHGTLYFSANDGVHGQELWKSDGTAVGTVRLSDITSASPQAAPHSLTPLGNQLLFAAYSNDGWELWKSDGTPGGTTQVVDLFQGETYEQYLGVLPNSSHPAGLVVFHDRVYFAATTPDQGRELWQTDGTPAGTVLVKDLFPGSDPYYPYGDNSSNPDGLTVFRDELYFAANSGIEGRGLWKTDGTSAGTVLLRGQRQRLSTPSSLTVVGDTLLFAAFGVKGGELWKTDGTRAGTWLVKDIRAGLESSLPTSLTNVGGKLFFVAGDGTHGRELWQSDGTAAGTQMVRDLREGLTTAVYPQGSDLRSLVAMNGVLFFTADDGQSGRELWKSTGIGGETAQVRDLAHGPASSAPDNLFVRGSDLYFSAITETGRELWRAHSEPPRIAMPHPPVLTYTQGSAAILLVPTARVFDADTPVLRGGRLSIAVSNNASPGDRLQIFAFGHTSVVGNQVLFQNVVIGTFTGGRDSAPLVVDLNLNATTTAVEALVRRIGYRSESTSPVVRRRTIQLDLTDGDGAAAIPRYVKIDVVRN